MNPADFKSFIERDPLFDQAVSKMLDQVHKAEAELTRDQFIGLMFQAIASGDFIRQVRQGDRAQAMIYVPFAEQERLRSRIKELEDEIERLKDVLHRLYDEKQT